MESMKIPVPEFLHLTRDPTDDDIRYLLKEMIDKGVTDGAARLISELATMKPVNRLSNNFTKTLAVLNEYPIRKILEDGLMYDEYITLIELDNKKFSERSRITARSLMSVKERWFLVKSVRGFYNKLRGKQDGYLEIKTDD